MSPSEQLSHPFHPLRMVGIFDILALFLSLYCNIILFNLCHLSKPDKVMISFQASEFAKVVCDLVAKENPGQMHASVFSISYSFLPLDFSETSYLRIFLCLCRDWNSCLISISSLLFGVNRPK